MIRKGPAVASAPNTEPNVTAAEAARLTHKKKTK